MSSTPKRFTRYEAEFHAPDTLYVLAEEHDAAIEHERRELDLACDSLGHATESAAVTRQHNTHLTRELERARAEILRLNDQIAALSYPAASPANPLLTVESGGIRYVLEVVSDEDGDGFEVKSATPTEAQTLDDFASSADAFAATETDARKALAIYRAAQREDDEAGAAE